MQILEDDIEYAPMTKELIFESLDGAGKTTHIASLINDLENLGLSVASTTSPGKNTFSGCTLRSNIAKIEDQNRANRLFSYDIVRSDRSLPKYADVIIADRGFDSVRVSNGGDISIVDSFEAQTRDDLEKKIIYLDIPPDVSFERESKTSTHPIDLGWLTQKYDRYGELIRQNPEKYTVIDATQPIERVYQAIKNIVLSDLAEVITKQRQNHVRLLDAAGVVKVVVDSPVEVKPGVFLPMFVNLKEIWSNPELREWLVLQLTEKVALGKFDYVMGLESGGSYYSVSVANELKLPVGLHRSKTKTYSGATGDVVGAVPKEGSRVALIDDVYATGQSGSRAIKRLKELGCDSELFTLYSYSSDQEMEARLGKPATSVTYFKGIRQLLQERGNYSTAELAELTRLVDIYRNTLYD